MTNEQCSRSAVTETWCQATSESVISCDVPSAVWMVGACWSCITRVSTSSHSPLISQPSRSLQQVTLLQSEQRHRSPLWNPLQCKANQSNSTSKHNNDKALRFFRLYIYIYLYYLLNCKCKSFKRHVRKEMYIIIIRETTLNVDQKSQVSVF